MASSGFGQLLDSVLDRRWVHELADPHLDWKQHQFLTLGKLEVVEAGVDLEDDGLDLIIGCLGEITLDKLLVVQNVPVGLGEWLAFLEFSNTLVSILAS